MSPEKIKQRAVAAVKASPAGSVAQKAVGVVEPLDLAPTGDEDKASTSSSASSSIVSSSPALTAAAAAVQSASSSSSTLAWQPVGRVVGILQSEEKISPQSIGTLHSRFPGDQKRPLPNGCALVTPLNRTMPFAYVSTK